MFVKKAAVVGAGTMGGQIAQTIAGAGIPVVLKDISEDLVAAGVEEARRVSEGQLAGDVKKGKLTDEQASASVEQVLSLITPTTSYAPFADVDFVIEAVPERMEVKQAVFAELDAATPGRAVLASNTSSLSISEIAEVTLRPENVLGFHYFYPASLMPLIEVVEGEQTSEEAIACAVAFAQAIRKQPIVCGEVPGFVVNRILTSGMSEIWREQEQRQLSIEAIDEGIGAAGVVPIAPYRLLNLLGLDTVLHVAEHLAESYGPERFYVPSALRQLVADGRLGAKTGGEGVYDPEGRPNVPGQAQPDVGELVQLLSLKSFVEACLLLEEGVASHRDIDFGMMAGAGMDPRRGLMPPFMKADAEGLDEVLNRLSAAAERHGERFAPPRILRRLVAQGRLGTASGQGFYAYPRPDEQQPAERLKLESREDGVAIAWLSNPPMNALSPEVVEDFEKVWQAVVKGGVRALIVASANPMLFCAGADIRAFTTMDEQAGRQLIDRAHDLFAEMRASSVTTIAAVNGLAYGGGCELAMACDFRIAARSAIFGQPEIKLGIIPGFGGTQRLPALIGAADALEMNLTGEPILAGEALALRLANRVVADHELLDACLSWAGRLARQAPKAIAEIKRVSAGGATAAGIEAEKAAFAAVFASGDAKEGISAFLQKRPPRFKGS